MTNLKNIQLFRCVVKLSKEDSAFLYFILESNDNLCFYSTIPHQEGDKERTILIHGTIEHLQDFEKLLEYLGQKVALQLLEKDIIEDGGKYE